MANSHKAVESDPKQLKHAQDSWCTFTKAATIGVVSVVVLLVLMALFLV